MPASCTIDDHASRPDCRREKSQAAIDELRQEIDNRERQEAALRMQLDAALVGRKALADDLDKVKEELEQVRSWTRSMRAPPCHSPVA